MDFNTGDDYEGWDVGWRELALPSVSEGSLRMPIATGDPGMKRWLPFSFTTHSDQVLNARMRVSGGGMGVGQFYWTTYADQQEDEKKVVYFYRV